MYGIPNAFEGKLDLMLEAAAKAAGIDPSRKADILRAFWEAQQDEFDKEDIRFWLDVEHYIYTDDDVEEIWKDYRDNYDPERGLYSNIASAYYYTGLELQKDEET